ncbi:diacylglycerol kinase family protein [Corynebacterium lubricantis]|uniref:diacylglycerol kinase family protein n=1 Tax=Corynebacterium lubricantis TaxID=541095 RepID=UPI00037685A1|nr:diacylglycerol kinase family protein [Corynebacterium lubricantis]
MVGNILDHQQIRRVAVLTNPAAGRGIAAERAVEARREFFRRGIDVVALAGASAEASRELARHALDDDLLDALVVCGGDGLIHLALQEQAGSKKPLGIIPAGTGNDHAREYRIPLDVRGAVDAIVGGYSTHTDLGVIRHGDEERYFGTIAMAGFDSQVTERANTIKWPRGKLRYLLASGIEFPSFRARPARLETPDGEELFNGQAILCVVGNTKSYGGGMTVVPDADHHDGLFDITVLEEVPRRTFLLQARQFMAGDFSGLGGAIKRFRVPEVTLHMPGVNTYVDGDRSFPTPVSLRIAPGAGHYLVPKP